MNGLVSYFESVDDETLRLVFKDVSSQSESANFWGNAVLFTYNDYPIENLKSLNLSNEEFAMIGQNLIIRLLALDK
ncbi:MAG: hypothetical protein B0W54_02460 [Cellvibrio sp. 79]|nr:MAG: hypothetical protein B0W54_02460 [Cellvibrio sp. 79]